jgi:UTP--glucose-1-phosphate uridylyltransferase
VEVARRSPADRKGGHLAVRRSDGQLILREAAQTAPEDLAHFTNENRHRFFNTNNLWFDLEALLAALASSGGVLGLPLIRNVKTVDPADAASPEVYQIETAMGAAIEVFPGAQAIEVGRERFLPVKTTNDLLLLRSDAYDLPADAVPRLAAPAAAHIELDRRFYATLADFDVRFPAGPPSLRNASRLSVTGDWTFGSGVSVVGAAELAEPGGLIPDGARIGA